MVPGSPGNSRPFGGGLVRSCLCLCVFAFYDKATTHTHTLFAHIDKLILICAHSLLYTYVQGVCTHPWSWQLAASPLPHQSDADVPRLRLGSAGVARSSMMVLMYSTTSPAMVGPSRVQSCSSTSVSRVVSNTTSENSEAVPPQR